MTSSFHVLDKHQKIFGNFLLEASAGTGKTFTIAHLVLRFILESDPPIPIIKIGVSTFTKAAAFELKKRIKDLLVDTKTLIEQDAPIAIYAKAYNKETALLRLKEALIDLDRASISTLHGLSYRILKKHSLLLKLPLSLLNPEEHQLDNLAYDFVKSALQGSFLNLALFKKQKQALLASHRGDFHSMILSIKQKLLSGLNIEPLLNGPQLKEELLQQIQSIGAFPSLEELHEYVGCFKLSPLTLEEARQQIAAFYQVLLGKKDLEEILFKKSFFHYLTPDRLKAKSASSIGPKIENFFLLFQKSVLPLLDQVLNKAYIELVILQLLIPEFEKYLEEKNILSFQTLLKTLNLKLEHSFCLSEIRRDFDVMVIDEFQDTDPIQWAILKKLFVDHPVKAFYMVGDPKQAIYTFRAADVYTYLEAKKTCPHLQIASLSTCYRSEKSFISALNVFFKKAPWIQMPHANESFAYQDVMAIKEDSAEALSPYNFYHLGLSLEDSEKKMVALALSLQKQNSSHTIALLVKDRFQLERVEKELILKGALFEVHKQSTLNDSIVYDLLYSFLYFLELPLSPSSLNTFLTSPWFNFTILDFEKKSFEDKQPLYFSYFLKLKNHCLIHSLASTLELFLDSEIPILEKRPKIMIASLYGSSAIDQLFILLLAAIEKSSENPQEVRLHLEKLKKAHFKLPSIQSSVSVLSVMTSHMSKGLEFDHVIALGISTRLQGSLELLQKRHNNQLQLGVNLNDHASILSLADLDAEKLRQMYVAITRAKKSVHIPVIKYEEANPETGTLSPLEYYALLMSFPETDYLGLYKKASFFNLEDALKQNFFEKEFTHIETIIESNHEAVFRHLELLDKNGTLLEPKNSPYLSFSSLKQQSATLKTDDVLKGRDYGDLFHNLIEDLLKSGRYQNFQDPQSRNYIKSLIDLSPFSTHSEEILNHLEGALKFQFPINDQSFCLLQIPLEDLYIEESFSYQTDQGIMKGFIDCIVVFQNEVFFIDWKTTLLPDVSADSIAKHMQEASYFLQLDIYKKALDHFCNYFQGKIISKAFYVFIKNQVCFEKNFKEFICLN